MDTEVRDNKMKKIIHRSESRGFNDNGSVQTYYTFCFANYYNPRRINFGVLRVLNEKTIDGGGALRSVPHDNMEIIVIPLEGSLEHTDNFGNHTIIAAGDGQIMSAGMGITHREYNSSNELPVRYILLWIFPREYELEPVYSKVTFDKQPENGLLLLASPDGGEKVMRINQDAWIYSGKLTAGNTLKYNLHDENNGIYIMILAGNVTIEDVELKQSDAIGIEDINNCEIKANEDSRVMLIEVPMTR